MSNATKPRSKRIFYLDAIRALAIICVITFHVAAYTRGTIAPDYGTTLRWFTGDFFINCMRMGVDLFLMLAGALSLGREWDIKTFLGKRLPRIIYPFLFWGLVLSISLIAYSYFSPNPIHQVIDTFTPQTIINYIISAFRSKAFEFIPYWFFWMILGTYFIMPIFNKWLLHSKLEEAEYFLVFWLITCLFDYTLNVSFPIQLRYFTGPIGFVVLGYYLRHTKRKIFDNYLVPILLIIIAMALQLYAGYLLSSPTEIHKITRYSILMAIEVTGVFLLFRNLDNKKTLNNLFPKSIVTIFKKAVFSIAKYSYGFYLTHMAIVAVLISYLRQANFLEHYTLSFAIISIGTIAIVWILMATLNRVPYINKIIGAK